MQLPDDQSIDKDGYLITLSENAEHETIIIFGHTRYATARRSIH